ncbi:MAG: ABC transporter ATP-binding protein [Candidatus Methylopumilus sp.]|nr:ABC transporter ATP-binding protein [Candidatus Methylopumilus sp.]
MKKILEVKHLIVSPLSSPRKYLVNDISFDLYPGRTTCIVGESGSGKSLTALSITKLLSQQLKQEGQIFFKGKNISSLSNDDIRPLRGKSIAMIFQEPMTSLNPVLTIGDQIKEALKVHFDFDKKLLDQKVASLLNDVGISSERISSYPDELSGGQRQRVMIAMSISCEPSILIADEPTTALDVTVQAQIIKLLQQLKKEMRMTMLFITHDFGLVEDIADDVIVMYQGKIVEKGSVLAVLKTPRHPYTKALLQCVPDAKGIKKLKSIKYENLDRELVF